MIGPSSSRPRGALLSRPWLLVALYAALILAGSSLSARRIGELPFSGFDKLAHFVEYGLFSVLIARAMRREPIHPSLGSGRSPAVCAIVIAVAWAALDESYQRFTGRNADLLDLVADGAGAIAAQIWLLSGKGPA